MRYLVVVFIVFLPFHLALQINGVMFYMKLGNIISSKIFLYYIFWDCIICKSVVLSLRSLLLSTLLTFLCVLHCGQFLSYAFVFCIYSNLVSVFHFSLHFSSLKIPFGSLLYCLLSFLIMFIFSLNPLSILIKALSLCSIICFEFCFC